ncbi:hypothetical protein SERLA73DRAFT_176943 [Serpula lacrymans var. lacrymans S7.3]|uniref:Protein-lysine N-methyltransferase EFM6 n=2 Tax=Serpula lacrymans var. lacrymans TaxID=341189 RepID=F8PQG3_SERL3|nr:uncharacterized protein SERLADRAFT_460279 [Serpula lacrymans var. lacrymans S7.9]EGO01576.1 hypothetical protein SERLA73DRAFT_176943 [Serpula lacrymans var. lacrymans S7.3]EGO27234.1 hypothetical protein SERLADRAFT_460279 [Serpula lacrymans var. lacrymans S7.9]
MGAPANDIPSYPTLNEIAQDEALDALDPLRHLRNDDHDTFGGTHGELEADPVVPAQPRSIFDQTLHLSFSDTTQQNDHEITIALKVDASPGCGGIAWPAGEVLANYLALRGRQYIAGKTILELGSGTGLVGLVAGVLEGKVWITDQAPLLDIMRCNVKINQLQSSVSVSELNWGDPLPSDLPMPDLILAADCVYFEPAFPLLVQTLSDLATETTDILFCFKKRRKADKRFFALLKKKFSWTEIKDDPNRDVYSREAISLLMLSKRHLGTGPVHN